MANQRQSRSLIFNLSLGSALTALAIAFLLIVVASQPAQAQTYKVIYNFTGGQDGATPTAGVTWRGANLYGTASGGGYGCGTVYKLTNPNGNWIFAPLYKFTGGNDGCGPFARVIIGPNGSLYGTTNAGGNGNCGIVFNVRPSPRAPRSALEPWTETVLYRFLGQPDGCVTQFGDLVFDEAGNNLYGTTYEGGPSNGGTAFELAPSQGGWTESVIYSGFVGGIYSGVIFDTAGNLYGTAYNDSPGGSGYVYELTPSGPPWTRHLLYDFEDGSDGGYPIGGLIFDRSGNLYGTSYGGQGGGGTVFELTPSNGSWKYSLIYSFTGGADCGPDASLHMDGAGNLYGTTGCDGLYNAGNVFKLTPSGNGWTYTSLHDFTGGSDGSGPFSNVEFDSNGNLYGTTTKGGTGSSCLGGCGVVWEITP